MRSSIRNWTTFTARSLEGHKAHLIRIGMGKERHPPANKSVACCACCRKYPTFSMRLKPVPSLHSSERWQQLPPCLPAALPEGSCRRFHNHQSARPLGMRLECLPPLFIRSRVRINQGNGTLRLTRCNSRHPLSDYNTGGEQRFRMKW